jgi:hypothetical protein
MLADVAPLAGATVVRELGEEVTIVLAAAGCDAATRRLAGARLREPEWLLSTIMQQRKGK